MSRSPFLAMALAATMFGGLPVSMVEEKPRRRSKDDPPIDPSSPSWPDEPISQDPPPLKDRRGHTNAREIARRKRQAERLAAKKEARS